MSALQSKTDLASLNIKVDTLDVDKPQTLPTHSSQLSFKAYNDMIKKTLYDKLVTKFNAIDNKIVIIIVIFNFIIVFAVAIIIINITLY